jgi:trigger factor
MYTTKRNDLPKNTIEIIFTVDWSEITKEYDIAFEKLRKELVSEGFRKGKVPKKIAESKLKKQDVYDAFLRVFIPKIYGEYLDSQELKPIVHPKIELISAKEGESWEIKLTTAIKPTIKLNQYKAKIKAAKEQIKKSSIWTPGKDKELSKEDEESQRKAEFQASFDALLKEAEVELSDLIIEEEIQNKLTRLVDDIQKVGLTLESYLSSKKTTLEDMKKEMKAEIEELYKTEFLLQEIADTENIVVENEELDKIFAGISDPKEKTAVEKNMYYYASLMRKQKTLDFIGSL